MPTPMSNTERNALTKVVKNRFAVLREEAEVRKTQLRRAIHDRIVAEHKAALAQAIRQGERLRAKFEKLQTETDALVDEMKQSGVVPGISSVKIERVWVGNNRYEYTDTVSEEKNPLAAFAFENTWRPAEIKRKVERELERLEDEAGMGDLALRKAENEVIERLLLGAVKSDEAQKFLAELPTVELLPDPDEVKQLAQ